MVAKLQIAEGHGAVDVGQGLERAEDQLLINLEPFILGTEGLALDPDIEAERLIADEVAFGFQFGATADVAELFLQVLGHREIDHVQEQPRAAGEYGGGDAVAAAVIAPCEIAAQGPRAKAVGRGHQVHMGRRVVAVELGDIGRIGNVTPRLAAHFTQLPSARDPPVSFNGCFP